MMWWMMWWVLSKRSRVTQFLKMQKELWTSILLHTGQSASTRWVLQTREPMWSCNSRVHLGVARWMATNWLWNVIAKGGKNMTDGRFCPWHNRSHDHDSHHSDTNWPGRRFLSQIEINPALFCEVVHWVLHGVSFCLVPWVLMMCFVDNLDDCEEKKRSFGSFGKAWHVQFCGQWWWIVQTQQLIYLRVR